MQMSIQNKKKAEEAILQCLYPDIIASLSILSRKLNDALLEESETSCTLLKGYNRI